ncbi:MAG: tRNA (adenine(22)-N(1))-methyltransferase [Clostridia bacterium]
MDSINLSQRLKKIASLIPKCNIFADVGTDHGYLAIYAIQRDIAQKVIASDIAEKPLKQAENKIKEHGLSREINTRLGPGLEPIEASEIDGVVIAGMGGNNIFDILEDKKDVSKDLDFLILQPQNNSKKVRLWLLNHGYKIVNEELVIENNIIYQIIKAIQGISEKYSDIELEFGLNRLIKEKGLLKEYLRQEINKCKKIIIEMNKSKNSDIIDKKNAVKREVDLLEQYLYKL